MQKAALREERGLRPPDETIFTAIAMPLQLEMF